MASWPLLGMLAHVGTALSEDGSAGGGCARSADEVERARAGFGGMGDGRSCTSSAPLSDCDCDCRRGHGSVDSEAAAAADIGGAGVGVDAGVVSRKRRIFWAESGGDS